MTNEDDDLPNEAGDAAARFYFVAGNLALDMVNTEAAARGRPLELLPAPEALAAWWEGARRHHPEASLPPLHPTMADDRLLAAVQRLRAALRQIFQAVAAGEAIPEGELRVLNEALASGREVIELSPSGEPSILVRNNGDQIAGVLLPLARSAALLLTGMERARLHRCANGRCVLLFLDATKSGTRRWCSTGCMNRWRSSDRYRKRKAAAAS